MTSRADRFVQGNDALVQVGANIRVCNANIDDDAEGTGLQAVTLLYHIILPKSLIPGPSSQISVCSLILSDL